MTPASRVTGADASQLDLLLPLFLAYLSFYGKSVAPEDARHFLSERLRLEQSTIFLAWQGEQAVGFVQLYPTYSSLSLAPSWILNDLFVAQDARGTGSAEALMAAALDLAKSTGAVELFLQTARDNHVAQKLYERLGYQRDDTFLVYCLDTRND